MKGSFASEVHRERIGRSLCVTLYAAWLQFAVKRPRPLTSPSYPPPSLTPDRLPRITVSCLSRIRICPRIRHVWGPDRIYRALNAAYRKSISENQQQLLFMSLSRFRWKFPLSLSLSLYRIGPKPSPSSLLPPYFLSVVFLSHLFIRRISVCQFLLLIHSREKFFKGRSLLHESPLNSSRPPLSFRFPILLSLSASAVQEYPRNDYIDRSFDNDERYIGITGSKPVGNCNFKIL